MELKNVFGARLKNARVINGMSMDDLCAKMNNLVSKQTISKYESGKMLPNSTNITFCAPLQFQLIRLSFARSPR